MPFFWTSLKGFIWLSFFHPVKHASRNCPEFFLYTRAFYICLVVSTNRNVALSDQKFFFTHSSYTIWFPVCTQPVFSPLLWILVVGVYDLHEAFVFMNFAYGLSYYQLSEWEFLAEVVCSLIRGGELSMCLTFSQPEGLTSSVFVHTWLLGNCWRDLAQRREPLSIYLITSQSGDGWTLSHCHVVLALYSWGHKPRNFSLRPSAPPHLRFPESLVFKWIYVLRRGRVNLGKFKPQGNSFSCTVIKIYVESVATGSKNRSR